MCGIVGLVGSLSEAACRSTVTRMTEEIIHRGPDDVGIWSTQGFGFGMRRLSIIDLAGGHQPIWRDPQLGIVFNGEIYNFEYLRSKLTRLGHRFTTTSDTEVALACYEQFGESFVDHLDGMFAVAIIDLKRRKLFLARDRLGKKPLYYGTLGGQFYFASEIKAIIAVVEQKPALNLAAIDHYLSFRYVPWPETIWTGIQKLPPAHVLSLDIGDLTATVRRYWSVNFASDVHNESRDYAGEFVDQFHSAVEKRLLASDVPVGIFLSGGLDSSAVCAAAYDLGYRNIRTFSVGHTAKGKFDETKIAEEVAAHLGFHHRSLIVEQSATFEHLDEIVWHTDEPLADLSTIPLLLLSRLARQDVKVILSGEGGDEIFAGYASDKHARVADRMRQLGKFPPWALRGLAALTGGSKRRVFQHMARHGWAGYVWAQLPYGIHFSDSEKANLWRPEMHVPGGPTAEDKIVAMYDECRSSEAMDVLMTAGSQQWLVEDLLMKADKISMAASLELRCPFLDHRLVEWAQHLPLTQKIGSAAEGYTTKRILRDYCRPRLPSIVTTREKVGFATPAYEWLRDPAKLQEFDALLVGPDCHLPELFRAEQMRSLLAAAHAGDPAAAQNVWVLIVLGRWLKRWM